MTCSAKWEILSPVGNREMLIAAVRSGADAVYLGADEFSARRNAENFGTKELKEAIEYCHIRGVKVYLTLNILIKDNEMAAALELAQAAHNFGIDGIIIQDIGLAALIKKHLPKLPLHASTQMSVMSPSALDELKEMGFCRVVAAREMSKCELEALCNHARKLEMEIEVFVHGALCMSVSGQCRLSAFLGSRSGNRGLCAGPCRLPFGAEGGTGFDLSLKDLSLTDHLNELCKMGVTSFKIEGRMKRPEYVAAATAACRSALYESGVPEELENALCGVFSRSGFTDGYFTEKHGKNMFGIRTKEDVSAAASVFPRLHELYRAERQSVPITAQLAVKNEMPICLKISDGKNTATAYGKMPPVAINRATTEDELKKSVQKLGNTPYVLNNLQIELASGLFVRAAEINDLRREAVEKLNRLRAEQNRHSVQLRYSEAAPEAAKKRSPKYYIRVESNEQLPNEACGISGVIFPLQKDFVETELKTELIVEIPRGIADEDYILRRLSVFAEKGFKSAICGNPAAVQLAKKAGFKIWFGSGMNVFNSESASATKKTGAEKIVLSTEMTFKEMQRLSSPIPCGALVYGKIPLMLFRNCPVKNGKNCEKCGGKSFLTDRLGTKFPVKCGLGYGELLNSVPLWVADKSEDLKCLDFAVLYFTDESPERVEWIIKAYKHGEKPDCEHTNGLFYRGVL